MRAVLMSLKPYYYYLIGEEIKEIEVRKGQPTAKDWNKEVLLYMSKDEKSFARIPKEFQEKYRKHFGKVGLKFVCDDIIETISDYNPKYRKFFNYGFYDKNGERLEDCLTDEEKQRYGKGGLLYGWHISNLKIYDNPKELGEFRKHDKSLDYAFFGDIDRTYNITRPPQSWCYVEIEE